MQLKDLMSKKAVYDEEVECTHLTEFNKYILDNAIAEVDPDCGVLRQAFSNRAQMTWYVLSTAKECVE